MTQNKVKDNRGNETKLLLREEYELRKEMAKRSAYADAVELLESRFIVLEKIDTATISKIVDAMSDAEDAVEPYLDKLPALRVGLDEAKQELTDLVTGKGWFGKRNATNVKKTSGMLIKAMAFYQNLSYFFSKDLPVLLKFTKKAKAEPDEPVGIELVPMFQQALEVDKKRIDLPLVRYIHRHGDIPYINNGEFAHQLSMLSYNELLDLSRRIIHVPQVATRGTIDQLATQATGGQHQSSAGDSVYPASLRGNADRYQSPPDKGQPINYNQRASKVKAAVASALEQYVGDSPDITNKVTKAVLDVL